MPIYFFYKINLLNEMLLNRTRDEDKLFKKTQKDIYTAVIVTCILLLQSAAETVLVRM